MSSITKSPFARPTSVMSLLAEQMESSYIGNKSQPIEFKSVAKQHSNISSSAPTHRHSLPGVGFNCIVPQDDYLSHECNILNESDLSSPQLPPKRLCHSTSTDGIARPIPIKGICHSIQDTSSCQFQCHPRPSLPVSCPRTNIINKSLQKSIRPIISPHYKKSAFTPTRSLTSPQTTSSDYSMSPDIESPIYRPASGTSSGFNDCSQQSLLIDPNYSPESNQTSTCATIVNTRGSDHNHCIFPRCHSQPCDAPVLRSYNNRSVVTESDKVTTGLEFSSRDSSSPQMHAPMKRRYPSQRHTRSTSQSDSTDMNFDLSIHIHCHKPTPNSADTSPIGHGPLFTVPKRDGYFFGHSRTYLSSLPRIASSPPPILSSQIDPQTSIGQGHRQRMGSNSSSLSTSTTTDANTPTIISNNAIQRIAITDSTNVQNDSADDISMEDSWQENNLTASAGGPVSDLGSTCPWSELVCLVPVNIDCASAGSASDQSDMTTKSYSTTSDCTNASYSIMSCGSRSRDHDDPPDMIGGVGGFCFSELNDHHRQRGTEASATVADSFDDHSSFQEALDLDQIELD